ncbi:lanthionine synthetase C family protein [Nonomuraea gerenzanensis]|uniref:Lanthionine biosynthesis cyclase LanC n=1 Tax=Nonomuraea gerenzanensis TaxID=93944 RepID=A0A1M4E5Y2_9ACTN|nr:lanthionine synthetase C family protein [Nonomuraea gerenzanensis]UBU16443.1 lanthionine synthetase C family protein [Nonomuraea gerenzanensis]SBO94265.1 Lanthionine biosynthesis cyclase LanC [Nonomuraea gerenzanensis]
MNPALALKPHGHPQSLSRGAAGIALLHIERAATGHDDWNIAHAWLTDATSAPLTLGPQANLLFGAPALAFALHGTTVWPDRDEHALATLDHHVALLVRQRLDRAHTRIDLGTQPSLAEFDLFKGLTGLGAHLLRRHPGSDLLADVLIYLVQLTQPLGRDELPGWWTHEQPTGGRTPGTTGGHGNLGMAHGISGPLALLSRALLSGISVDGQSEAIARICAWTDTWQQHDPAGPWWPEIITLPETRTGHTRQTRPARPSWCYGTPGHARAQQLAALALGDPARQQQAEYALTACLTDPAQLRQLTEPGLCHGVAGVYQTVWRAARDARTSSLSTHLPVLAELLAEHAAIAQNDTGLLDGAAGLALAMHTATHRTPPHTGWDTCLLIT